MVKQFLSKSLGSEHLSYFSTGIGLNDSGDWVARRCGVDVGSVADVWVKSRIVPRLVVFVVDKLLLIVIETIIFHSLKIESV